MGLATLVFACAPDPMNPVGFSDAPQDVSLPESRQASGPKETLAPLASFAKAVSPRFWAEGHSYRRYTIEVWANEIARTSTQSGSPAAVGSEFVAAHFVDEKEHAPVMFFTMRKEASDGGGAWTYRAYDAAREAMVVDSTRCAACHAMARSDSRFTLQK
jgi:hypothetical protein